MGKHKSEDYKLTAVKYYNRNKNQVKTCKIFNCSERSLMRWVKKYDKYHDIKRKTRKYIAYKIKNEYVKFLKDEIHKDKTITILDLTNKLNNKFNISISKSHINKVIRDQNITLKQTRLRHEPVSRFKQPVNIRNNLSIFYNEIKKYNLDDIICIDETSLNSFETRKHCYEKIGKRCTIKTNSNEVFKKYTGIFAITNKKCIGYEIYNKGGIDSNRLETFINKFISGKYKNKLIILDNASSHRNQKIKDLITKDNKLLYSVVYQHFTNAIENFFSVLKSKLRKTKGIGYNTLLLNVKECLDKIPEKTFTNLFNGSYNRKIKFTKKKSNRERPLKNYL